MRPTRATQFRRTIRANRATVDSKACKRSQAMGQRQALARLKTAISNNQLPISIIRPILHNNLYRLNQAITIQTYRLQAVFRLNRDMPLRTPIKINQSTPLSCRSDRLRFTANQRPKVRTRMPTRHKTLGVPPVLFPMHLLISMVHPQPLRVLHLARQETSGRRALILGARWVPPRPARIPADNNVSRSRSCGCLSVRTTVPSFLDFVGAIGQTICSLCILMV